MKAHSNITRFPKRKKPTKKQKRVTRTVTVRAQDECTVQEYFCGEHGINWDREWEAGADESYAEYLNFLGEYQDELLSENPDVITCLRREPSGLTQLANGLTEQLYDQVIDPCSIRKFRQLVGQRYVNRKIVENKTIYTLKKQPLLANSLANKQQDKLRKAA